MAAGTGERFGSGVSKQFEPVNGIPLVNWSIAGFDTCPGVDEVIVVVPCNDLAGARRIVDRAASTKLKAVIEGGETRQESVRAALEYMEDRTGKVLVHDAARPCFTPSLVVRVLETLIHCEAVVPTVPAVDTLYHQRESVLDAVMDRVNIAHAQTPQGFHAGVLYEAHKYARTRNYACSDDGSLVYYMGYKVRTIPGEEANIKVTFKADLAVAEMLLAGMKPMERS